MRGQPSKNPSKQRVLAIILQAYAYDMDPRWHTVLLAIFWPGLDSISNRKADWDPDERRLWANTMWAFLQTVRNLDISRRIDHLSQRIISGTIHRLHEEYSRTWKCMEREIATDPEQIEDMAGSDEGLDFEDIERRDQQEIEIKRLRRHVKAGRLSEADFLILVATRVYDLSLAEYARKAGIDYQFAKKRRQRAEAALGLTWEVR